MGLLDSMAGGGDPTMPPARYPALDRPSPGPQAQPMPTLQAAPQPRPSLLERVGHALSAATGGASEFIRPQTPAGYEDLLTDQESQSARPGLLRSIFYGPSQLSPSDQYAKNLDAIVKRKLDAIDVAHQMQILHSRATDAQRFAASPSDTQEQAAAKRSGFLMSRMEAGDDALVKSAGSLPGEFYKDPRMFNMEHPPEYETINTGNGSMLLNKRTNQLVRPSDLMGGAPGQSGNAVPQPGGPSAGALQPLPGGGSIPGGGASLPQGSTSGAPTPTADPNNPYLFPKLPEPLNPDTKEFHAQMLANSEAQKNLMAGYRDQMLQLNQTKNVEGLQKQYTSSISKLTDVGQTYDKAMITFDRAMKSTGEERRVLFGALKSQFVQASDQSKNLRFQLLQYYEHNIDPSFQGTAEQVLDKMTNGEIPDAIMRPMFEHIKALREQNYQQIEARRKSFLQTRPALRDSDLPETSSFYDPAFPVGQGGASSNNTSLSASDASRLYSKYHLKPRAQ